MRMEGVDVGDIVKAKAGGYEVAKAQRQSCGQHGVRHTVELMSRARKGRHKHPAVASKRTTSSTLSAYVRRGARPARGVGGEE